MFCSLLAYMLGHTLIVKIVMEKKLHSKIERYLKHLAVIGILCLLSALHALSKAHIPLETSCSPCHKRKKLLKANANTELPAPLIRYAMTIKKSQ